MSTAKDTIYIDVDDEITSIIDKVQNAQEALVALVLPKRAAMLQSSVNMKLLKRASDKAKKNLVLITTEAGLLPLASSVGIYVAKNLQSKPEIPKAAKATSAIDEVARAEDEEPGADFDKEAAAGIAVGALAGDSLGDKIPAKPELTPLAYKRASDEDAPVMLDNSDPADDKADEAKGKDKKDKSLKVPNFERFRTWLIIGVVVLLLLIVGFIFANKVLPKAAITISTNTTAVNSTLVMTLSPTATALNTSQLIVPANLQQSQQTASKQVATTGQKNEGNTATGAIKIIALVCGNGALYKPSSIPAGVSFTSNNQTYITQEQTTFNGSVNQGSNCQRWSSVTSSGSTTTISAQYPGASYNVPSGSAFSSSYQDSNNSGTIYSGTGSASGGTDDNVQIVSQTDITNATSAIVMPASSTIKSTLTSALTAAGYVPLISTYSAGTPTTTDSANVGDQASNVTVTETITYTMFGVKQSNLNALIVNSVDQQINTSKQTIQATGLNQAVYSNFTQTASQGSITMQTSSTIGPHLNLAQLKSEIVGMKKADVASTIEQNPGVTGVTIQYSPFWVSSTPKNINKITIVVKKAS